ncbi:ABC transporter permease [Herbivorax sp. ANBcel31]|uniref:ABC transporter permease n=1 Tax=Herbivorax sp. ANBcel31 TaxID=3069754 RepID=UPI0027AE7641|nr:ABC transporter permease [Herbivorax sp. ANBcel31]MDQ2085035.1 ABC transporter permease [Herbivorax sp. ANBcel31]
MITSLNIAINNIRRIIREPMALFFLLVFPIIGSSIGIIMVSFYDKVEVAINIPLDEGYKLPNTFNNIDKFNLVYYPSDAIEDKINTKEIDVGIVFPEDFEYRLKNQLKTNVKIISLKNNANVIHVRMLVEEYIRASTLGTENADIQILRNAVNNIGGPRLSISFMFMSILVFVGTIMELVLEDKKKKTFTRLFCAPVKNYEFILGTLISVLFLGSLKIYLFLLITKLGFGFDWKTTFGNVFLVLFFFLLSTVGINIGLIGLVRNTKVYLAFNVMVSIFSCFAGGAFLHYDFMGETLEKFSNFFPQKWGITAYEKLVDGYPLDSIVINLLILILFGAVFASIGIKSITPSENNL